MNRVVRLIKGPIVKRINSNKRRDPELWVFGEWFGERCCDNSLFFANYVAERDSNIHVVWIAKKQTDTTLLNPCISVVCMDTVEAKQVLKKCGVAIISQGLKDLSSDEMNYLDGAISVHLWHGIPWKKIGHDGSARNGFFSKLYRRINDYSFGTEYYASPSDEYDIVAESAHGAKKHQMIHVGYPRNSVFYSRDSICQRRNSIIEELKKTSSDIEYSNCRIIVYMPTFRKNGSQPFSFNSLLSNKQFVTFLEEQNVVVIQKAHFVDQKKLDENTHEVSNRIVTLNNVLAQDLLCAADLLVSDYSGAFFDYLLLDRPIIHYLYDYENYKYKDRGLYYDKEDVMAGEEADDETQLVDAIIRNLENPNLYQKRRQLIKQRYVKYDSENSCEELYSAIVHFVAQRVKTTKRNRTL